MRGQPHKLWKYGCVTIFTTFHFLRNLIIGPISKSVCNSQAFPAYCNVMLWLIGLILKLRRKWSFGNTDPSIVFTTFHFLRNLWISPISKSVCNSQAFPAYCNVMLWLIGLILKLWRKWSFGNTDPSTVFTTFHCLRNLRIGPISLTVP